MEENMLEKKESEVTNNNQNSNKKGIIAILIVVIIALIGAVIYFAFIKKDEPTTDNNGSNNQQENGNTSAGKNDVVLSNDEAISIAKAKLELANTNNLIGDTCFDGKEEYSEEGIGSMFCYYGSLDNFKNKFYMVYSTQLEYKDVFEEYKLPSENVETNVPVPIADLIQGYAINGDKVYTNSCTIGTGAYNRMDNFTVDSISADTIKLNYVVIGNSIPEIPDESEEYEYSKATMTLVKENGDWKILKATIVNMCNGVYEVGK